MPTLDKVHKQWKGKGLVVLGISSEEPEPVKKAYEKLALSYTTALDPEHRARSHYGGGSIIPFTVILDRKGRVAAEFVGGRPEKELVDLLRRAGLK